MATDNSNRVRLGKRIVRDRAGIYRSVTVFGDPEPEEEVRQIRTWHPGPLPEPEQPAAVEPVVVAVTPPAAPTSPAAVKPPAKKRPYKPRPYKPRPKKTKAV